MSPLFLNKSPVQGFDALLARISNEELCSPFRSNLPLLSLLRDGQDKLAELQATMRMPSDAGLHVEYTVKPPMGRGKASHSDLMIRSGKTVAAIEAKWTEPRYETVSKWIAKGKGSKNYTSVLDGWLGLLQNNATRRLKADEFGGCVYQLIHRAASACSDCDCPKLAYMIFHLKRNAGANLRHYYREDLGHLHDLLGCPEDFPFYLFELELTSTQAFDLIKDLPKRKTGTPEQIRKALLGPPLFIFGELRHHRIVNSLGTDSTLSTGKIQEDSSRANR